MLLYVCVVSLSIAGYCINIYPSPVVLTEFYNWGSVVLLMHICL